MRIMSRGFSVNIVLFLCYNKNVVAMHNKPSMNMLTAALKHPDSRNMKSNLFMNVIARFCASNPPIAAPKNVPAPTRTLK